jgi:hypothetical protein
VFQKNIYLRKSVFWGDPWCKWLRRSFGQYWHGWTPPLVPLQELGFAPIRVRLPPKTDRANSTLSKKDFQIFLEMDIFQPWKHRYLKNGFKKGFRNLFFFTYEDNKSSHILLQKHYVTLVHISEHTIGKTKKNRFEFF